MDFCKVSDQRREEPGGVLREEVVGSPQKLKQREAVSRDFSEAVFGRHEDVFRKRDSLRAAVAEAGDRR